VREEENRVDSYKRVQRGNSTGHTYALPSSPGPQGDQKRERLLCCQARELNAIPTSRGLDTPWTKGESSSIKLARAERKRELIPISKRHWTKVSGDPDCSEKE